MLTTLLLIIAPCLILFIWSYINLYNSNQQLKQEYHTLSKDYRVIEEEIKARWEEQFNAWCIVKEKEIRKDAMTRSRRVMRGQATEHLAPLMMDNLNLKDFRFMGNPIDYIIFKGASDILDNNSDEIESIIFLDVKTGNSKLNKIQRRIRDCIENSKVEFLIYNPDKDKQYEKKNLE